MKVSISSEVNQWKCGREVRHIFVILASPLVSLIGNTSLLLFLAIVWVGEVGSSSFWIGSSNISGFSPTGSSYPLWSEREAKSNRRTTKVESLRVCGFSLIILINYLYSYKARKKISLSFMLLVQNGMKKNA